MLSNTNIVFRESEKWAEKVFDFNYRRNGSANLFAYRPPTKAHAVKPRVKAPTVSKSKQSAKTMQFDSLDKYTKKSSFAPILEEENYDNVIVNKTSEDRAEETSGPSYLSALKFATVYNDTVK